MMAPLLLRPGAVVAVATSSKTDLWGGVTQRRRLELARTNFLVVEELIAAAP